MVAGAALLHRMASRAVLETLDVICVFLDPANAARAGAHNRGSSIGDLSCGGAAEDWIELWKLWPVHGLSLNEPQATS